MPSFSFEKIGTLTLGILFLLFVLKFVVFVFIRPYRGKFMTWYMKTYSRHYKAAKQAYDEVLLVQEECAREGVDISDGYYKFFEHLMANEKFRTTVGMDIGNIPLSYTADDLTGKQNPFLRNYEYFIAFFGEGKLLHKIEVMFNLEEDVRLLVIRLFYHEEYLPGFYRLLEVKKFPPRDDSAYRKRRSPNPVPTRLVPA